MLTSTGGLIMDEVPKSSNNNSSTSPQVASLQGTALQEAQLSHVSQQMSLRGPTPLTVVHLSGDQVQGVIHTAQTSSVIHSPQGQSIQVSLSENEDSQDSSDSMDSSQKARGLLARRPSYRKILNDLSSEDTRDRKGDESNAVVTSVPVTAPVYQTSTGQYTASGDMQAYQLRRTPTTTSLPQTVVMTTSLTSQSTKTDDPQLKREIRLMKNREAARECRRKKKEYVKCLENRVAVLENQNKTLIEELKTLKDLYCHKSV
ncbi:Cyclic AMP-dependent transcription factor ATF-1, partial [Ophiophagus hannah]